MTSYGRERIAVFGSSELAELMCSWLHESSAHEFELLTVDRAYLDGAGDDVRAFEDVEQQLRADDVGVHVAIGYQRINRNRRDVTLRLERSGIRIVSWIDPSASVAGNAVVGTGACIQELAVVQPFARLGRGVIVWSGAIVAHHSTIGDWCYLAPGAIVSGNATLGARVFVGSGAVLRDGITVGDGSIIGAGALVTRDVPPRAVVRGRWSVVELDAADDITSI